MSDHPPGERLDDYVDGLLDAGDAAGVEQHLRECDGCRAFVRRSRSLMTELRSLPSEVTPPRDLRPRPPIGAAGSDRGAPGGRAWRPKLAAAAVVLAILGTAVVVVVQGPGGRESGRVSTVGPAPVSPAGGLASRLRDYRRVSRELEELYRRRRQSMSRVATDPVDASLSSLDRAIRRTSEAVASDADGLLLRRMLATRYERKIELLRRTLDL